jgi:hypothetical protein
MIGTPSIYPAILGLLCCLSLDTPAATRSDYLAASLSGWQGNPSLVRSIKATRKVLHGTEVSGLGRGEIIIVRPLLQAWRESGDEQWFKQAREIVLSCNKVMLDGFDAPHFNNASQVAFALPELAESYPLLKSTGKLADGDLVRMAEMLRAAADYWLRTRSRPDSGNLDQRYALGVAMVANTFPSDERVPRWRAWASLPFNQLLYYPLRDGFPSERPQDAAPHKGIATVPATATPDNGEQSNLYEGATLLGWICLGEALGRGADLRTPLVRAWVERYHQQLLPAGIMPPYGDGCWVDAWPQWIGIFEWAGAAFQSPAFRAAADGIFRYAQSQGLAAGDYSEALAFADERIVPSAATRVSQVTWRRSPHGHRVPDKLLLSGDGAPAAQPFVFLHASEGTSHSHRQIGSVCAYAIGPQVLLHEYGYDAGPAAFHNMMLVRPPGLRFLNFPGDPQHTLLAKMDANGQRLTYHMPSDQRHVREATVSDLGKAVRGRLVMECVTYNEGNQRFGGNRFVLVRECVLAKDSGILLVRDMIESLQDVELACGPVWHVQHVLARNDQGFLCQDLFQVRLGSGKDARDVGTPANPVWVAMSGPPEMRRNATFWRFAVRSGRRVEAQAHHLTGEWHGRMEPGRKLSFLTAFVPQPAGTTNPPANVELRTHGDEASVRVGDFAYTFKNTPSE